MLLPPSSLPPANESTSLSVSRSINVGTFHVGAEGMVAAAIKGGATLVNGVQMMNQVNEKLM